MLRCDHCGQAPDPDDTAAQYRQDTVTAISWYAIVRQMQTMEGRGVVKTLQEFCSLECLTAHTQQPDHDTRRLPELAKRG